MQGISPVFVLEGKAPTLKHNTIAKRNNIRSGFRERKTARKGGRSQFNRILNECKEMLLYMGLACVQGHGEAEAMCAYLNEDGLVDGCISQDSDCFLYGAKVVYRNFCASAQGNRGGTGGAVDEYSLEKIERILNLGRNKMIALALLCGCDYDEGLNGVGKEAAMKLFKIATDEDILDRIRSWKTDSTLNLKEEELLNPNLCTSCGHSGKVQKHTKSGCVDCGTVIKCNDSFRKDPVPTKVDIQWRQPQINKFIDFMERHLSWEPQYAFEKIFPVVTRWQLEHLPNISTDTRLTISDLFIPKAIKKVRNIRSVASYEIIWETDHATVEKLREYIALDNENNDNDADILSELTSIESQDAVSKCYPELIEAFENAKNAKKRKTKKKAANDAGAEVAGKRKTEKRRQKKNEKVPLNNKKIDEFISKNHPISLEESFERMSITPKRSKMLTGPREDQSGKNKMKQGPQFDKVLRLQNIDSKLNNTLDRMFHELSPDDFISDCDDHDLNMSLIIDSICGKKCFQLNVEEDIKTSEDKENLCQNIESLVTVDQIESNECQINSSVCDETTDEFANISESYIPLNQRLLNCNEMKGLQKSSAKASNRFSFGVDALMNDTDSKISFVA
ncbi:unnamed protein product [Xylocopa violacea]|uniref:XPG-I domain-containing protein n=1 Tax=Xylocopa violacea TaxID=135666 RepID=A0ABP1P0P4_XYLVO